MGASCPLFDQNVSRLEQLHDVCCLTTIYLCPQSKPEDLKAVVKTIKEEFGISLVYCWHALHAYWNGVAASAAGTKLYSSQITFPVPTAGTVVCCKLVLVFVQLSLLTVCKAVNSTHNEMIIHAKDISTNSRHVFERMYLNA